ncbi:hypothetical protein [Dactylosporangium sp. CA-139066]|uniref:hypothetical protein n=1 Tax=Dactylosporangium sp. CA-139066 TaxID=3239930 RepID=UPI003D91599B
MTALRLKVHNEGITHTIPCVRTYPAFSPDGKLATIATNFVLGGRESKLLYCEFELSQPGILIEGWNASKTQILLAGRQYWKDCGNSSFHLSSAAYSQRQTHNLPHDNSNLLPQ